MGTLRPPYQQKDFFRPGPFFLLKLKVTKTPIEIGAVPVGRRRMATPFGNGSPLIRGPGSSVRDATPRPHSIEQHTYMTHMHKLKLNYSMLNYL